MKNKDKDQQLFDRRISQRNISAGRINNSDLEDYLLNLPDLAESCEEISFDSFSADKSRASLMGDFSSNDHDE